MPKPKLLKARSKEQIIAALRSVAYKLGRTPRGSELKRLAGISIHQVRRRFTAGYRVALQAAGLKPDQMGLRVETTALLEDWGRIVRKVGAVPVRREYEKVGNYSIDCFDDRYGGWTKVPAAFARFVAAGGLAGDWTDVLEKIRQGPIPVRGEGQGLEKRREAVRLAYETRARQSAQANQAPEPQAAQLQQPGIDTANQQLLPPPLHGKKCVTASMLAVFIAELAPTGLQWITAACFPRRPLKGRPLLGAPMPGAARGLLPWPMSR